MPPPTPPLPPPPTIQSLTSVSIHPHPPFPGYGWAGIATIATAEAGLLLRIPPFPHWFFVFVWYGYILLIDALLFRLQGASLIRSRFREFLLMLPLSALCWTIFELFNLRLRNWQYHDLIHPLWLRTIGFAVAFATVFPAIFLTADLIRAVAIRRTGQTSPTSPTPPRHPKPSPILLIPLGLLCLILPLLWPRYFFPLVWIGFIPLLDPLNRRKGLPSLTGDLQQGEWRRILYLLLAGFVCGGLWEFWNFWAVSKWTYTVPFVGSLKIFEMPVLGFLGFPPFALECFCMYYFALGLLHKSPPNC